MITKEIIKDFTVEFPKRYLTLNRLKKLNKRDRQFHFNGHWNILTIDEKYLKHYYLDGGNGKLKEEFSKVSVLDIDKTVFIKWEDVFILFTFSRSKGLQPIYSSTTISTFSTIKPVHKFYKNIGVKVVKEILNINMNSSSPYIYFDAFTGEEIIKIN